MIDNQDSYSLQTIKDNVTLLGEEVTGLVNPKASKCNADHNIDLSLTL